MDYRIYKCPVCEESFKENDDVVVCPDCGTPHHRDCWKKNGRCFNEEKHGKEITLPLAETDENEKKIEVINEEIKLPETIETIEDIPIELRQKFLDNNPELKNLLELSEEREKTNKIGSEFVSSYRAAVGNNASNYVIKFKFLDKKTSKYFWNGAAFLVPLGWSVYRKMYKLAAIIFAVYALFFGVLGGFILSNNELIEATAECILEDPEFTQKIVEYSQGNSSVVLTEKQTKLVEITEKFEIPLWLQVFNYIVVFGTRFFMGMKSTQLYFKENEKRIEKARKKGLDGEALKKYLSKKYGTLPMLIAVIAGFLDVQFFLM